jgi:glycosyltransferase involved in cell wall biosynthesis
MKIHFLLAKDFFRGGGIETYTREVGRRLAARGHAVTVYSTRGAGACPPDWEGMRLLWLPRVKPYWAEKCSGALVAALRALGQDRPDVMHLHSVAAGSVAPLLRRRGSAFVLQMHGIEWMRSRWGLPARSLLKTMERTSLACADALTAVSQTQCDYFKKHYGADCEYIPTAADIKSFAPASMITELGLRQQEYILCAARLVPEKGIHYLIRAFRRLPTSQTLVIAGEAPATSGYEQELRNLAGEDPRIRFVGRVQGRLLQELFSNATLFVQPSELEGLSIGLIEAMSYGAACLASDIPENQEVVANAGILFRSKDVDDLEQQLRWSLANPAVLRDRAAVGKARALNLFTWDRVVDQLEALYGRTVQRVASYREDTILAPAINPKFQSE